LIDISADTAERAIHLLQPVWSSVCSFAPTLAAATTQSNLKGERIMAGTKLSKERLAKLKKRVAQSEPSGSPA